MSTLLLGIVRSLPLKRLTVFVLPDGGGQRGRGAGRACRAGRAAHHAAQAQALQQVMRLAPGT